MRLAVQLGQITPARLKRALQVVTAILTIVVQVLLFIQRLVENEGE